MDFEEKHRGTCQCGKWYRVGYADGVPSVVHEIPYCKDFEEKGVMEYLEWLRTFEVN